MTLTSEPVAQTAAPQASPTSLPRLLVDAVETVVLGKTRQVELSVAALLAGGHLMLEDEPGVGKTVLANALSRLIAGRFGRIQGSPDLLPSDIVGVNTFNAESREWEFHHGPVFSNVLLFDELNRSTPRAQSALLEAMAEGQATVDGRTYRLPQPFFVVATQNPLDHAGTFPLVEGQRDRFAVAISLGLPSREVERSLLLGNGGRAAIESLQPVASADTISQLRTAVAGFHVAEPVVDYALDLVTAVRATGGTARSGNQVLSTRASESLVSVGRGIAALRDRSYVTPADLLEAAPYVLAHRARPNDPLPVAAAWVHEVISAVPAPTA